MKIQLVGIGMGSELSATGDAVRAIAEADVVVGARRMLDCASEIRRSCAAGEAKEIEAIAPSAIVEAIKAEPECENVAVICSGDTGFFSLAASVREAVEANLADAELVILPGISTVQYLASKLGRKWQNVKLASVHGRDCNILGLVISNFELFLLTGGDETPSTIIEMLNKAGLGFCDVVVAERLSYEDEKITCDTAAALAGLEFDSLSAVWISHGQLCDDEVAEYVGYSGIPDDLFIRGFVPMTKRDVRAICTSRLRPAAGQIVWDIGAGTGSISVETASLEPMCTLYAIETKPEGCELIGANRARFGAYNIKIVEGRAPEALADLPAPDIAFVGGSTGSMTEIVDAILKANPAARIIITAIALETIAETQSLLAQLEESQRISDYNATQIASASSRKAGRYHLMQAESPILIFEVFGAGEQA